MAYNYEFVILSDSDHRFIETSLESESVVDAFHSFLKSNSKLIGSALTIYCRRPRSGDLQFMGTYDGMETIILDGIQKSRILKLANGSTYELETEGFRKFLI